MTLARTLAPALAVSVGLHLGAWWMWKGGAGSGTVAASQLASRVEFDVLAPVAALPTPLTVAPPREPQRVARARSAPPSTGPGTAARLEPAAAAAVEAGVEQEASPELEAAPAPMAGPIEARAAEPPLDTSALSQRLQEVARHCYPPAARRFRQTGEAQVRFCLDSRGGLQEAVVTASSGLELLDRAATQCVIPGAAPFGAETFGRCFTLPVRFQ